MGWHRDSPNSLLHMAVSIRGRRALHSFQSRTSARSDLGLLHVDWQEQGDVYVSSPWAFLHGVEYPTSDWGGRVVALQCRFLMTRACNRMAT